MGHTCDQAVSRERMPAESAVGVLMGVHMATLEERVTALEALCRSLSRRLHALEATFTAYSLTIDPLKRIEPAEHEDGGEVDLS